MSYFGQQLTNAKFVRCQGSNLPTGDNDLYTVPAGRKALIFAPGSTIIRVQNPSGGAIAQFIQIKSGGVYYNLGQTTSVTAGTGANIAMTPVLLEAGEIVSINTATNSGLNVFIPIVEFDASVPIVKMRKLNLATGDNTIYTCPAGKTAIPLGLYAGVTSILIYSNKSGSTSHTTYQLVPSGQSPGTAYYALGSISTTTGANGAEMIGACLEAGDYISVNTDIGGGTGVAGEHVWGSMLELDNFI